MRLALCKAASAGVKHCYHSTYPALVPDLGVWAAMALCDRISAREPDSSGTRRGFGSNASRVTCFRVSTRRLGSGTRIVDNRKGE